MCSKELPHCVNHPIRIYKVLEIRNGKMYRPYVHKKCSDFPDIIGEDHIRILALDGYYHYENGFIFAYTNKTKALAILGELKHTFPSSIYYLYEGEIPAGVNFAVSENMNDICARKITIKWKALEL